MNPQDIYITRFFVENNRCIYLFFVNRNIVLSVGTVVFILGKLKTKISKKLYVELTSSLMAY